MLDRPALLLTPGIATGAACRSTFLPLDPPAGVISRPPTPDLPIG